MTAQLRQREIATPRRARGVWPLERILFGMAGVVTLASALLAAVVSPWWLLVTSFVGLNQLAFVAFGECVASLVLRRLMGVERGCVR